MVFVFQDYSELKVALSDIPVNPGTCSELVRLCLRKRDVSDSKSDTSEDVEEVEEEVVRHSNFTWMVTEKFKEIIWHSLGQKLKIC